MRPCSGFELNESVSFMPLTFGHSFTKKERKKERKRERKEGRKKGRKKERKKETNKQTNLRVYITRIFIARKEYILKNKIIFMFKKPLNFHKRWNAYVGYSLNIFTSTSCKDHVKY
jgi:hypothetical protein